ncbi:MAG TPA: hypothetical protein V6D34_14465 [Candidatus Sericytochromatia bacterium]
MSLEKGTLNLPFTSFLYKAKSQAEQIFSFCLAQFIALIKAVKAPDLRNSSYFNLFKGFPIHPLPDLFFSRKSRSNIFLNSSVKQSTVALDDLEAYQPIEGILYLISFVYLFKPIESD